MTIEDRARLDFLEALSRSNVALTEWESNFVDSTVRILDECCLRSSHIAFTARQREKIDQMEKRYRREL